MSGTPHPLAADELASLAKAALYFEPALDALVPPERAVGGAYWCQSNRASQALRGYPALSACSAVIDGGVYNGGSDPDSSPASDSSNGLVDGGQLAGTRAVVEAMNLFPAASAYGRAHGKKADFVRGKVFKWDFSGMLPAAAHGSRPAKSGQPSVPDSAGRGTVEFRQPPGSLTAGQVRAWVTLALALVNGVVGVGFSAIDLERGGSLDELWAVLAAGAAGMGWGDLGVLEELFAGRAG